MTRARSAIAFVTSAAHADSTPDDRLALSELDTLGIRAVPAVWDDPAVPWGEFSAVVLRSTWDYYRRYDEFLAWLDRTARVTTVWNPPELVRWNSHKRYLLDVAAAGARVVPTEVAVRGSGRTLSSIVALRGWSDVVVKPAVGADAYRLRRMRKDEPTDGEAHLCDLLATGDALVQPFVAGAERAGERSLVFFDGKFSHATEYAFVLGSKARVGRGLAAPRSLVTQAQEVVAHLSQVPLYARADFLPGDGGEWLLGELELIEPDLFLRTDPAAPQRFARAIADWWARLP